MDGRTEMAKQYRALHMLCDKNVSTLNLVSVLVNTS